MCEVNEACITGQVHSVVDISRVGYRGVALGPPFKIIIFIANIFICITHCVCVRACVCVRVEDVCSETKYNSRIR